MQEGVQRPVGVTILAVLSIIGGILLLLGGIALLGLGGAAAAGGATGGGLAVILGVVLLVIAALELAFGIGAWMLKPWAWMLGVISQVGSLVLSLIYILTGSDITSQLISIIIAAVILYYLFTPNVRRAFGRA
jgi:uncharacterized membrane protein (DUF2068 family)